MENLNIDEHYAGGGNYFKAADLNNRRAALTISVVSLDTNQEGQKKINLAFEETEKTLTLNKTNAQMIANLVHERDGAKWIGTTISIRPDRGQRPDGTPVDVIRVDFELPAQKYPQSLGGRLMAQTAPMATQPPVAQQFAQNAAPQFAQNVPINAAQQQFAQTAPPNAAHWKEGDPMPF